MTEGISVRLRGVRRTFTGGTEAIGGIDLYVDSGAFVVLLGPSGCGKSTLLRLIAGLDHATSGTVELSGEGPPARGLAYVFQDANLLPWRSVLDNVRLPLELAGKSRAESRALATAALGEVGLAEAVDRFPAELSGGMRMRVSLARAVVTRPRLLLLDEPFAALDEITRQRLDDQLRELHRSFGMTVVFVTHSVAEAAYLAERAVVFSSRPATIVVDRTIELPKDRTSSVRTEPAFVRELAELTKALERGSR
jgi:NitT/TauT family transport system ATP-binding protein